MGQALYRTHRPKKLAEIIGQEHITDTLGQALKTGRLSHAYLFTGPRGTGKTSIARILAHEINDLPYTDDSVHMDIIEIDAASNRRIDEIRELRDKVYVAPTSAKYKVYIIDEVHMLTKEAFNALLKTLEEPPAHVVFILATTDAHKLPETIISRTQRYSFKPVDLTKVVDHLRTIATSEKITISDDALQLLAEHGEGSFRDSISLLDQASGRGDKVELADVQALLGIAPADAVQSLVQALANGQSVQTIVSTLSGLYDQGFQAALLAKQIAHILRTQLLAGQATNPTQSMELLAALLDVPTAHDPERFLEITLIKAAQPLGTTPAAPTLIVAPAATAPTSKATPKESEPIPEPQVKPAAVTQSEPLVEVAVADIPSVVDPSLAMAGALNETNWPQVLDALKSTYNTLYGVIRMAKPKFSDNSVELSFTFAFHQKRIKESKNQKILSEIIQQITGQDLQIVCVLAKDTAIAEPNSAPPAPKPDLAAISNIFGGGEVL